MFKYNVFHNFTYYAGYWYRAIVRGECGLPLPLKNLLTWAIFHKRGTCLIVWDMLTIVVSGLEIE